MYSTGKGSEGRWEAPAVRGDHPMLPSPSFLAPLGGREGWVRGDVKWLYLQVGNLTCNNTPEVVVHFNRGPE